MKVLWSINAFEKNIKLQELGRDIIVELFSKKDTIIAAYIASNAERELAVAFNIPISKRYSTYPKKILKKCLTELNLSKLKTEILFEKSLSLTSHVKTLINFSKLQKIDLIIISSTSKKKFSRIVLGSFAEAVIHLSTCDLLIYHQDIKFHRGMPKKIVYAHDFTPKGYLGFEKVIDYVKKWNSELIIVHIPVPGPLMTFLEFQEATAKQVLKLEKRCAIEKIKFTIYVEEHSYSFSEVILRVAEDTKADIVSVTAKSNRLEALLGGSTTRHVLHKTFFPTLVLKV